MKTQLFYFSSTGNSLVLARRLVKRMPNAGIISIPRFLQNKVDVDADIIGIIFPVYVFGLPLIVSRFLSQLKGLKNKYIFAVATYGGMAGDALGQMKRELKAMGSDLNAGFCVKMPGNYTPLYGAISKEKQIKMFEMMEKRIDEIISIVRDKKPYKTEKSFPLFNLLGNKIYQIGMPAIMKEDKWFVVEDKCNGCGTCVKICPVEDIIIVDQKPVWLHHCEQCMACLQWCPKEAIQMGKLTKGRKRYHHPEVTVKDFIN